jgi:PEP-CTERM motif
MHKYLVATTAAAALAAPAHALTAGDIAFTTFNADEDGWALVTFVDIAPDTTVFFSDNEWDGSAFNTGESYHQWTSGGSTIAAGTVLRFSSIDTAGLGVSIGNLSRASVAGSSNYGMSQSEESIYAYQATSVSGTPTFLAAINSTAFGTASAGFLTNTGLSVGVGAVQLGGGADFDQYTGPRGGLTSWAAYKPLVSDTANWTDNAVDGSYANELPDTTAFTVTAIPEPGSHALLLAGLAAVALVTRRRG